MSSSPTCPEYDIQHSHETEEQIKIFSGLHREVKKVCLGKHLQKRRQHLGAMNFWKQTGTSARTPDLCATDPAHVNNWNRTAYSSHPSTITPKPKMGSGQSTARGRRRAPATAAHRRAEDNRRPQDNHRPEHNRRPQENPIRQPMNAVISDLPHDEPAYEDDHMEVTGRYTLSFTKLTRLSRVISIKMTILFVVVATFFAKDYLAQNSPYLANLMGWRSPECNFNVPATSRMRVAWIHVKLDFYSKSFNESKAIEFSIPNMTSIYPVRGMKQPDNVSDEFKVLVCDFKIMYPSRPSKVTTPIQLTELPPFITFLLEDHTSNEANNTTSLAHTGSDKTTGNVSSQNLASRP